MVPIVVTFSGFQVDYPNSYKLQMKVNGTWTDIGGVSAPMGKANVRPVYTCPAAYIPFHVSSLDELKKVTEFRAYVQRGDDWQVASMTTTCKMWVNK